MLNTQPEDLQPTTDMPEATTAPVELTARQIFVAVLREVGETIILALIMLLVLQLLIRNFRVEGHSMDPNLHDGQYLVVDKISYHLPFDWRTFRRGDVVVFVPPTQPDKDFVKRIIALPGETIEMKDGTVYINDEVLPNNFGARLDHSSLEKQTVPEGSLFVMGDNRPNSNDSRNWGMLPTDAVLGRTWFSYWPPDTWGSIPADRPADDATLSHWLQTLIQ